MADELGLYVHLTVTGGGRAVQWYEQVFEATLKAKHMAEDGERLLFAILAVFGSHVFVSDEFPESGPDTAAPGHSRPPSCTIHIDFAHPHDVNKIVARAEAAGATVTMKPEDVYWGDRYGRICDPFGHVWSFGARAVPQQS
ncbi:MAG: VOC family protein [Hyphomicrobium sp.]